MNQSLKVINLILTLLLIFQNNACLSSRKKNIDNMHPNDSLSDIESHEKHWKPQDNQAAQDSPEFQEDLSGISEVYVLSPKSVNQMNLAEKPEIPVEAIIGGVAAVIVLGGSAAYLMKNYLKKADIPSPELVARDLVEPKIKLLTSDTSLTELSFPKKQLGLGMEGDLKVKLVDSFDEIEIEDQIFIAHKKGDHAFLERFTSRDFEVSLVKSREGIDIYSISKKIDIYEIKNTEFTEFASHLRTHKMDIRAGMKNDLFTVKKELGSGASGTAYLVDVQGKSLVAKRVPADKLQGIENELRFHAIFNGGSFPKYYGSYKTVGGDMIILMEPLESLKFNGFFGKNRYNRKFITSLLSGYHQMHRKGMGHFDIKRDNILARRDGSAVIIDFGISRKYEANILEKSLYSYETKPPEFNLDIARKYYGVDQVVSKNNGKTFEIQGYDPAKSGVYQAGVVLWELKMRKDSLESLYSSKWSKLGSDGEVPALYMRSVLDTSNPLDRLVFKMLNPDPKMRPTMAEVLKELHGVQ